MNRRHAIAEIVVLSGKGGVGKTSLSAALATVAAEDGPLGLADADVDAANLGLVVPHSNQQSERLGGGRVADIDPSLCLGCMACASVCNFDAIRETMGVAKIDDHACEGCGACAFVCSAHAVQMRDTDIGSLFRAQWAGGPLIHARLDPGGENSGSLVAAVRAAARQAASEQSIERILIDGPPGIGCPTISAASGVSRILAVTEPGPSAAHDVQRLFDLAAHFGVPVAAVVNRCDLDRNAAQRLDAEISARGVPILAHIPRHPAWTAAQRAGVSAVTHHPALAAQLRDLWQALCHGPAAVPLSESAIL